MRRVVLALLGGTVLLAVLMFWIGPGAAGFTAGRGALLVFAGVLAAGLLLLYYCCQRGLWAAWRFVLLGAFCGLLCVLPLYGGPYLFGFLLLIFVAVGAACGWLFWLAAIWRNRELTYPKFIRLSCGTTYKVARKALKRRCI